MSNKNEITTAYTLQQCILAKNNQNKNLLREIMYSKKFQNVPHVMDK